MSPEHSPLPIPLQGVLASQRSKLQWLRYRTGQPLLQAGWAGMISPFLEDGEETELGQGREGGDEALIPNHGLLGHDEA